MGLVHHIVRTHFHTHVGAAYYDDIHNINGFSGNNPFGGMLNMTKPIRPHLLLSTVMKYVARATA